ncbi:hypothetical protein NPIL_588271 [Nephila pilipes]|uniref:Uncharacterized protein n=1 Tax=Nephila pilipes TaxID=299642 RepID=A0A8X6QBU4_NEPPI|nr:hypothetical protein NPIL_588271 [Nephila pilipes]
MFIFCEQRLLDPCDAVAVERGAGQGSEKTSYLIGLARLPAVEKEKEKSFAVSAAVACPFKDRSMLFVTQMEDSDRWQKSFTFAAPSCF